MTAETIAAEDTARLDDWSLRPWLLAAIGGLAGLIVHLILESGGESPTGAALAGFTFFAALAASFVLTPHRWKEAAIFALGLGMVMGGIAWLLVDSGDSVAGTEFAFAAGVFFSLLAIPLFQADFHRRRWATPYVETHFHVWSDAVSASGALAFVLLSWLLLWLLQALFSLIGFEFIEVLIDTDGFAGFFIGVTFGAAMGVLRNQLGIIGTLQRVVMLVFSLLAVPFALAIVFFLAVLIATGGSALWEATDSATPVLLACALGSFVLANAVVRDDDAARSDNVVLRFAAFALSASIFPLTVFAAISLGIRIDQHGLSPERLWGLIAIGIATAYGLAYWVGLARGRWANWSHFLRRANLHLAAATCVIALILALPVLDFGWISARQQVARLDAGEVSPEEFDFAALRWNYGDAGRAALERLAQRDGRIGEMALEMKEYAGPRLNEPWSSEHERDAIDSMTDAMVVYPSGAALPDGLREAIGEHSVCWTVGVCRIYLQDDPQYAVVLGDGCAAPDIDEADRADPDVQCEIDTQVFRLVDGKWGFITNSYEEPELSNAEEQAALERERRAIESGDVRIGRSSLRTVYIGDKDQRLQID